MSLYFSTNLYAFICKCTCTLTWLLVCASIICVCVCETDYSSRLEVEEAGHDSVQRF